MLNLIYPSSIILALSFLSEELTNVEGAKGFTIYRNPGCNATNCSVIETKLIQVIFKQPNKTVHFILPGNSSDAPLSFLMLEAEVNSDQLNVNWTRFQSRNEGLNRGSITLEGVRTSYGFILYEVNLPFHHQLDNITRFCHSIIVVCSFL